MTHAHQSQPPLQPRKDEPSGIWNDRSDTSLSSQGCFLNLMSARLLVCGEASCLLVGWLYTSAFLTKLLLSLTSNFSFKGPQKPIPGPRVHAQNLSSFKLSQLWKPRIWPEQGKMNFSTLFQILKKLDQGEYSITERCWVLKQVRGMYFQLFREVSIAV